MAVTQRTQNNFTTGILSPLLYPRMGQEKFNNGCVQLHNMLLYPQGSACRRAGTRYIDTLKGECRFIPFIYNSKQRYLLELRNHSIRIWYEDTLLCSEKTGEILEIESPYHSSLLTDLQYAQTTNTLYFASPFIRPYKLVRTGHDLWELSPMLFEATVKPPSAITISGGTQDSEAYSLYICSVDDKGRESANSEIYTIHAKPSINYPIECSWTRPEGAIFSNVYIRAQGEDIFSLRYSVSGTSISATGNLPTLNSHEANIKGPFSGGNAHPSSVAIWQQRLIFGASFSKPQTIWFSKIGTYENFIASSELVDDDAITVTISSTTVEPIQWIHPHREVLFIGTSLGEWSLSSHNGNGITPYTLAIKKHTSYGTCSIPPIHVGDAMVFIQRDKKILRQLQYVMEYDSFIGNDLSITAEHIVRHKNIISFVWQQYPNLMLWILLDDGTIAGLTFIQEYGIFAWTTHNTKGFIESLITLPSAQETDVYMVVCRTIQGKEVRYLEKLHNETVEKNKEDARYMDCFKEYKGIPQKTIVGLEHLEGEDVCILADGTVQDIVSVRNGTVELSKEATTISVGLIYESILSPTLHIAIQMKYKGTINTPYSIGRIYVYSTQEEAFYISSGNTKEYPSAFSNSNKTIQNLYLHTVAMPLHKTKEYAIMIKQYMPVQMTICSITVDTIE